MPVTNSEQHDRHCQSPAQNRVCTILGAALSHASIAIALDAPFAGARTQHLRALEISSSPSRTHGGPSPEWPTLLRQQAPERDRGRAARLLATEPEAERVSTNERRNPGVAHRGVARDAAPALLA